MRRIVLLALLPLLLGACPRRIDFGPWGRIDDPAVVLEVLAARYGQVQGLVGEGRLVVDTEEVDGTLRMAIEVVEPANVYLETVDLVGTPRGTFATSNGIFAFYDPGENRFHTGPANERTIGIFLPVALPPEELAGALLGEIPLLLDYEEGRVTLDEAAGIYLVDLRRGGVRQRIEVATRDLRLVSVRTRGRQAIDASFADHRELLPGLLFPTDLTLETPRARVRVRYTDVRLNPPLVEESFRLQPPPGARIERW